MPTKVTPKSTRTSRTSLISIDPVIASQITEGISTDTNRGKSGHARTESSPAQTTTASHTATRLMSTGKTHERTNSTPGKGFYKGSSSLRRAKNSTDLLKAKSTAAHKPPDSIATQRGRTFTVSNVTTGGLLHLTPSPHQGQGPFSISPAPPSSHLWAIPTPASSLQPIDEVVTSRPSSALRTRSISPKRLLNRSALTKIPRDLPRPHVRSQSFSTVDESRRSLAASTKPQTLKIVINRPDVADTESDDDERPPTLEIPIPHYKLGTPRFSAHGTPILRGSSYTRVSGISSINESSTSHQIPTGCRAPNTNAVAHPSAEYTSPITASMYDKLQDVQNEPYIVRYSGNERNITAATKIRIIAQISSESFMDYELVSDFFLTFRAYMTTFEVLDYLLARLRWSIGRLSDDGRIVRIRTFAALRHWILNYYTEDFVINRRLRVRFCEEVNNLYDEVLNRPKGAAGVSDLKILQDLKRCWNGRSAAYWDAEENAADVLHERPLQPGGVLGSRDPTCKDISQATELLGEETRDPPSPIPSAVPQGGHGHQRQSPSEPATRTKSTISDGSVQPTSCSLPRYHSRSPDKGALSDKLGPRQVTVLARRQNAPSELQVHTGGQGETESRPSHRQQPSTDRTDTPTPAEALLQLNSYDDPHAGSMIRGFVYGPVQPFFNLPTTPPLSPSFQLDADHSHPSSPRMPHLHSPRDGPAVKNIFGSIRRALSGKQTGNEVAVITTTRPSTQLGKRAHTPMNLVRSSDDLRRRGTAAPPKTQLRIDLLCAAAVQSFQQGVPSRDVPLSAAALQDRREQSQSPRLNDSDGPHRRIVPQRLPSHHTERSGSILIVDDTAVPIMPVMSGALVYADPRKAESSVVSSVDRASHDTRIFTGARIEERTAERQVEPTVMARRASPSGLGVMAPTITDRDSGKSVITARRISSPRVATPDLAADGDGKGSVRTTASSVHAGESLRTTSPPPMTDGSSTADSPVRKLPPALRRMPGGNLKANEKVHEMEVEHHRSADSILDSASVGINSVVVSTSEPTLSKPPPGPMQLDQVSLINTRSSQHFRASFEAAVKPLTSIPDVDDGGLEVALLKLEGRWIPQSPESSDGDKSPTMHAFARIFGDGSRPDDMDIVEPDDRPSMHHTVTTEPSEIHPGHQDQQLPQRDPESTRPLLRRQSLGRAGTDETTSDPGHPTVTSSSSVQDGPQPGEPDSHEDDMANMSDLSSELSVDVIEHLAPQHGTVSPIFAAPGTAISGLEMPSHPLTHASLVHIPGESEMAMAMTGRHSSLAHSPTPHGSPVLLHTINGRVVIVDQRQVSMDGLVGQPVVDFRTSPAHVPFVLAYDSKVLAEQMTIVEQSALIEIEWNDLVEMRWHARPRVCLDWAEYMSSNPDARGIDVVTTRFDLVSKWCLSEIMLTQDADERARVLSKLIHVAAHARRLRNYATMLQLTLALTHTACARLTQTWARVPGPDRSVLSNMEALISPRHNFATLRSEMESTDASLGCIPFIGLYIRDLTYNASKPAEIYVDEYEEPLINFERFRTAAIIIKGLLRLIDASVQYRFEGVHGVIERCLWICALSEDRIHALSKQLEA